MQGAPWNTWIVRVISWTWLSMLLPHAAAASSQVLGQAPAPAAPAEHLDVPFLAQTERLCGGAAAAMILRYWGDRRADVQQFAPLVDARAGGIATDRLAAAIAERGWRTERLEGTITAIRAELTAGRPPMLLIQVRPGRYHFVVAVGADDDVVVVHDPAVGPARRYSAQRLEKVWAPTGFWALRIRPLAATPPRMAEASAAPEAPRGDSRCDRALAEAVDDVRDRGFESADEVLGAVRVQCPTHSGPISELAGVRFAQRQWNEAEALAAEAIRLNPADAYALDVLGSTRFVKGDLPGALDAWNDVRKPRLDSVVIEGLTNTHYTVVAQTLGLMSGTLVTRHLFERAQLRLQDLPTRSSSRLSLVPEADGWAKVRASVVERQRRPRGWFEWASIATESVVRREVSVGIPGWTGQGELWAASWRWWQNRPRYALTLAAPRSGRVPGIVGLELSLTSQTYAMSPGRAGLAGQSVTTRLDRLRGAASLGHWITNKLRYEVTGGLDGWDDNRKASFGGLSLNQRWLGGHLLVGVTGRRWWSLDASPGFQAGTARATWRSSTGRERRDGLLIGTYSAVSAGAPLIEWPGAGDQGIDSPLLRAHPLTHGGIVDGAGFGRRLWSVTAEGRQWLRRPSLVPLGLSAFVDTARASEGLLTLESPLHVDLGVGIRLRIPGRDGVVRLDYARGLRDGAQAVTLGWAP